MDSLFDVLRRCPLFNDIKDEDLCTLINSLGAKSQKFGKGETILAKGEPAKWLGIVLSGSVQTTRVDYSGNRSIVARFKSSELFGEALACAGAAVMPFNVVAVDTAELMLIDAEKIIQTGSGAGEFWSQMICNLLKIVATQNLVCNQKLEIISKRSTRGKLMAYLTLQAKNAGSNSFTIPFDRQELADYLEVDRSGLSAEISKLRKEQILLCKRNKFTLL